MKKRPLLVTAISWLLIASGVAKVPVRKILLMLHLLMLAEFIIIVLSCLFPEIVLFLPRLLAPQWL